MTGPTGSALLHRIDRLMALVAALSISALVLNGCASGRSTAGSGPQPEGSSTSWAYNDAQTLGEKLGRLDALMRTAPPDSLRLLRAEYRRLLEERTGQASLPFDGEAIAGPATYRAEPRTGRTLAPQGQPLRGFRPSELGPGASRTARSTAVRKRSSVPRPHVASRRDVRAAPVRARQMATRPAAEINARGMRQNEVNGIAAARVGNQAEAVERLGPVVSSGKASVETRYLYARALERTGQKKAAADEYLRVSRSATSLGQKSYLDYCRVLGALGERSRARSLVAQFIKDNPTSEHIVEARQLLQRL